MEKDILKMIEDLEKRVNQLEKIVNSLINKEKETIPEGYYEEVDGTIQKKPDWTKKYDYLDPLFEDD